ncbi:23S rRNA (adenine(1618)-N(6))-methyltransferase RlmF [Vibrio nitrifigilis]
MVKPTSVNAPKHSTAQSKRTTSAKSIVKKSAAKAGKNGSNTAMQVKVVKSKAGLHKRNRHHGSYDFKVLSQVEPKLKTHIKKNPLGQDTISFSDPEAVKLLNKALLHHYYGIQHWDIPHGFLCPPIPGRADYIHRLAELLFLDCPIAKTIPVTMLDVGIGANCIYPMIATVEYDWQVVGSDIDPISVKHASELVRANAPLRGHIECRLQKNSRSIFKGVIEPNERYTVTTCNPPFHSSLAEAMKGTERKRSNLKKNQHKRGVKTPAQSSGKEHVSSALNFGGQKAELWCPGGEAAFLKNMAVESAQFAQQVLWFSSLISKKDNVRWMKKQLEKVGVSEVQIVEMAQGQKISRFIAWSFQNHAQRKEWITR